MQMSKALDIIGRVTGFSDRDTQRLIENAFAFYPTEEGVTERHVELEAIKRARELGLMA